MEDRSPEQAQPINNTRAQVDQKVGEFFQKLPQLPVDSIFREIGQINDQLTETGENQEDRRGQIEDIAERVVTYKNSDEGRNGEMAWEPGQDKEFRIQLAKLGLASTLYGQPDVRRSLESMRAALRTGNYS